MAAPRPGWTYAQGRRTASVEDSDPEASSGTPYANGDGMSVSRVQIDAELHTAERALEAATERRRAAEHELWEAVGKSGKKNVPPERIEEARAELAEADRVLAETEA